MQPSDDLVALFEVLRRSPSPADKARALARAWRTIRGLSKAERRFLAREVGFDGAEELVEGLAARSGAAFAPAAVLEALAAARSGGSFSLRGLIADMKNPERRDELMTRGVDLVADALRVGDDGPEAPEAWTDGSTEVELPVSGPERDVEDDVEDDEVQPEETAAVPERPEEPQTPPPPPERQVPELPPAAEPVPEPDEPPEPEVDETPEPSVWDDIWEPAAATPIEPGRAGTVSAFIRPATVREDRAEQRPTTTAIHRLQELRSRIDELRDRGVEELFEAVDGFPEPWARRRALTALIDGGVPADVGVALELIESLDRPMDRSWCLSALARRGDLEGADLARALAMLDSPAARRRIERLAGE